MLIVPPRPALTVAAGPADCYFQYESASVCRLIPWGGNQIMIQGVRYTIPAAGIVLNPNASWAGYPVLYACIATNPLQISVQDPANPVVINSDGMATNNGWPIVGAFTQAGGSTFYNTTAYAGCISYFNRRQRRVFSTWNVASASTGWVELSTAARVDMLGFPGDHLRADYTGTIYVDTANSVMGVMPYTSINNAARVAAPASNSHVTFYAYSTSHFGVPVDAGPLAVPTKLETYLYGYTNQGTGTWYGDVTGVFDG